jgi:DNA ligase-1
VAKARGELAGAELEGQKCILKEAWRRQATRERFVFNKILTGGFRVGVSQELVLRAAAAALDAPQPVIARRLMGEWEPSAEFWLGLSSPEQDEGPRPYPFGLAHPLEEVSSLGNPAEWTAEWKWDGIRCQATAGGGQVVLWSRGEEALNESFPDVAALLAGLPGGTVVDGEILALDFASLQKRLGRKAPSKKLLAEIPCRFLAFDVLALGGEDVRGHPWEERRRALESLGLETGELLPFASLEELSALRDRAAAEGREGLMIKRREAPYPAGRRTGVWWKWKVAPRTVDAVLVYAQSGSGRRAGLYTDYTFALWKEGALVPFAKAYSGLTDAEIREVDRVIRATTLEKHGPVRVVQPTLVFEIAFEGVQKSSRHKSGLAVRFPRIAAWRRDKRPEDADGVEAVWGDMAGERTDP